MNTCTNCGTRFDGAYCPHCGKKADNLPTVNNQPYAPAYKPISAWGYVGYNLLFSLPIAGFILLIIFSFDDTNINRRNYARSYWCALLISLCIIVAIVAIFIATGLQFVSLFS